LSSNSTKRQQEDGRHFENACHLTSNYLPEKEDWIVGFFKTDLMEKPVESIRQVFFMKIKHTKKSQTSHFIHFIKQVNPNL